MSGQGADFNGRAFSNQLYDQWEKGMTAWWESMLANPAFLGGMGENMAAVAQARSSFESAVDDGLERAHLPTRRDMQRIASVLSLLEDKLLRTEDQLLAATDRVAALEKEVLQARVDAAEARVELRDGLARIEALLAGSKA